MPENIKSNQVIKPKVQMIQQNMYKVSSVQKGDQQNASTSNNSQSLFVPKSIMKDSNTKDSDIPDDKTFINLKHIEKPAADKDDNSDSKSMKNVKISKKFLRKPDHENQKDVTFSNQIMLEK